MPQKSHKLLTGIAVFTAVVGIGAAGAYATIQQAKAAETNGSGSTQRNCYRLNEENTDLEKQRNMNRGALQNLTDKERAEMEQLREKMRKNLSAGEQARMQELRQGNMHRGTAHNLSDSERVEMEKMRDKMHGSLSANDQARMDELRSKMQVGGNGGNGNGNDSKNTNR